MIPIIRRSCFETRGIRWQQLLLPIRHSSRSPVVEPLRRASVASQAPAPPELMFLAKIQQALTQFSQQYPTASSGLAKAAQGLNEAMSAITVASPQQQTPQMSPPY